MRISREITPDEPTAQVTAEIQADVKGLSILARSIFRQMRQQGYAPEQIIGLSSELIQLVREDLQKGLAAE